MTLSRNTEKVVQCKIQLVKAFSEAKKLLEKTRAARTHNESNNPPLPSARERLETIRLGMDLFSELGGWDKRTEVLLKDQLRNILLGDLLPYLKLDTLTLVVQFESFGLVMVAIDRLRECYESGL